MPYTSCQRPTKRVTLSDGYWIDVYTDLEWREQKQLARQGADGQVDFVGALDQLLALLIVDWNLDDETGAKLAITPENIDRLRADDATKLIEGLNSTEILSTDEQKKSSSKPSSPVSPATPE